MSAAATDLKVERKPKLSETVVAAMLHLSGLEERRIHRAVVDRDHHEAALHELPRPSARGCANCRRPCEATY